jgi:hypothetical protein
VYYIKLISEVFPIKPQANLLKQIYISTIDEEFSGILSVL